MNTNVQNMNFQVCKAEIYNIPRGHSSGFGGKLPVKENNFDATSTFWPAGLPLVLL